MASVYTSSTIGAALSAAVARFGARTAYIDKGQRYSFQQVDDASRLLASRLAAIGIGKGDRIAIIATNRIEWLYMFFAAARLGAIVVGLNLRYRQTELDYMLQDSQAKVVVSPAEHGGFSYAQYFSQAAGNFPGLQHWIYLDSAAIAGGIAFDTLLHGEHGAAAGPAVGQAVDPDDVAVIVYTSGTSGKPKGAALTHRSMLASAAAEAAHMRLCPDDLIQLGSPLNHVGGITCGITAFMLAGACIELVPEFKADTVLEMAARNPPTLMTGVPTMLTLLLMSPKIREVDLSGVRLVYMGGSNVDEALLLQLQEALPNARLFNLYGLTEASGAIVMTPWECGRKTLLSSIGKPLEGAEVRVVRADGSAADPGEVGELWFRGLGVIRGYIGSARSEDTFDGDGWLHTGDLGHIDQQGFIYLKGRQKDMYIQGGFNVYPVEVENVISSHPDVMMVAGIGVPDPVLGEIGRYFVVPRAGSELRGQDIVEFCRSRLADYKIPKQIVLRQELPCTPAGKIQKFSLRGI